MRSLIMVSLLFANAVLADTFPTEPHVSVIGSHTLSVVPDILRMSVEVIETGNDVEKTSRAVEQRSARLISRLKSLGVEKRDISSSELRITPHYNWSNRVQVYAGTEISRTVEVILRDLKQYHNLVRTVIDTGITRINRTKLEATNETEIRKKAMQGAIDDAITKAGLLVSNLPSKIGSPFSITSLSALPVHAEATARYQANMAAESFEPGIIEFTETVKVVFYLKN